MSDEAVDLLQLLSTQNVDCMGDKGSSIGNSTRELKNRKEHVHFNNVYGKKGSSQKTPKGSREANISADYPEVKEKIALQDTHSTGDMQVETKPSLDLSDDESLQGAPLSIKNFFKVVRTFSKRLPISPKPRLEPKRDGDGVKDRKETDVVVFERPTTPREMYSSEQISRSLPPVLDLHELLGSDTILDDEEGQNADTVKSESFPPSRTINNDSTLKSLRGLETQSGAEWRGGFRRRRCSELEPMQELPSDALQEFGSFDSLIPFRGSNSRKSRKSLGFLYNQCDEHETLHF